MELDMGKLPQNILTRTILSRIRLKDTVLLPPAFGEDGAVIRVGKNLIVAVADPITGATFDAGWLVVHVNANDVAVHAAYPRWLLTTLLFPIGSSERDIKLIMDGILGALDEIDASLIGGHTEITDRVNGIVISGFMIGEPMVDDRYVTSGGAQDGDAIILTKGAGIEGTFILASEMKESIIKHLDEEIIKEALNLRKMISILPEVKYSVEFIGLEKIHAMHDITEGGLIGGIYEMAYASNIGFEIYEENIPLFESTREICKLFNIDPLRLIGSGSLIISVERSVAEDLVEYLGKKGIKAAIIGFFTKKYRRKGVLVKKSGSLVPIDNAPIDELWSVLKSRVLLK